MTTRNLIIFASFFCLAAFYFLHSITSGSQMVGFLSDDALYLIMADFYSPWYTTLNHVHAFVSVTIHFPPLYSLVLGLFGAGTERLDLAYMVNVALLAISLSLSIIWLRRESGSLALSFIVPILMLFLPITLILAQELWSEFLFMVLLFSFFCVFSYKEMKKEHYLLCALLIGLMTLSRSIGLSVVIAFSVYLFIKKPKYYIFYIIFSAVPFVYWNIKSRQNPLRESYEGAFNYRAPDIFERGIFDYVIEQFVSIWQSFHYILSPVDVSFIPGWLQAVLLAYLLLAVVIGMIIRLRGFKIDALVMLFYLAIVLAWPFTEVRFVSRFIYPILPIVGFYMFLGNKQLLSSVKISQHALPLLLIIVSIGFSSSEHILQRAYAKMDPELKPYSRIREWITFKDESVALSEVRLRKRYMLVLQELQKMVPEDDCIYAIHPPLTMLHTQRLSGSMEEPVNSAKELMDKLTICEYFIASYMVDHKMEYEAFYPMDLLAYEDGFEFYSYHVDPEKKDSFALMLIKRVDDASTEGD